MIKIVYNKVYFKIVLLLLISIFIIGGSFFFFYKCDDKPPLAKGGIFVLNESDLKNGFVNLNGEFTVYDGLFSPDELENTNIEPKFMNLDDIRMYSYPKGTITAKMIVKVDKNLITGILLEEMYMASELYVNGELVAKTGVVSENSSEAMGEKKSHIEPILLDKDEAEIVIKIANHKGIDGQLKKHIFIGNMEDLLFFWNKNLIIKYLSSSFYFTLSLFFFRLFSKSRKYLYLFTIAIAGCLNGYVLITYFEPFILFSLKKNLYIANTWLQLFPTLATQFFSGYTVIIFYKHGWIYKNRNKFLVSSLSIMFMVIFLVIIYDKMLYFLYKIVLFVIMLFMIYGLFVCGKKYIENKKSAISVFFALVVYIVSYGALIIISMMDYTKHTMSYYNTYFMMGQVFFYFVISYITASHFSHNYYISELNEESLAELVREKTLELKDSYDKLLEQDVIRKQMLSDISHDLRSPITVIKGYLELLKDGKIKPENSNEYFNVMYNKVEIMSEWVDDLLYLAKLNKRNIITREIECLNSIIEDVANPILCKDHFVEINFSEDIYLKCNYKQIYRLFSNLIENACEYSEPCTKIYINGRDTKKAVFISIIDEGKGIPPESLPYIFDRFVRSDSTRNMDKKHFGLGLSIAKSIVENHDGEIKCKSKVGEGTSFEIVFFKEGIVYENIDS